jgi:hypothetical protein
VPQFAETGAAIDMTSVISPMSRCLNAAGDFSSVQVIDAHLSLAGQSVARPTDQSVYAESTNRV